MADNKYYWLKLKRDFFKRHDIQIIEDMENGKDYILFYLKLLCESVDHEGNLRFSETIPYNEKMLSTITNTNIDIVRTAMKVFTELNMIEILDDDTIFMTECNKMLGCETAWAEKKRRQRELPKLVNGCVRVNGEMLRLPDNSIRYVDEKRYGGNGMFVIDRAKGMCELCGNENGSIIHHNNGYSNEPEDLLYLCTKCHGKLHSNDTEWKMSTLCPPPVRQEKEKELELDKDIKKEIKKKKFEKPTLEEVSAYCKERNNGIDAEAFIAFYESKGWLIGKTPMRSWKSAIITWEKSRKQNQTTQPVKKYGDGSAYDYE